MLMKILTTATAITLAGTSFAQSADDDQMLDMTTSVLAGITGNATAAPQETGTDQLRTIVQQAMSAGQSDAYLEALISEAADRGDIAVPDAMRTTEGAVDTRTLLASLVSQSIEGTAPDANVAAIAAEATGETPAEPIYHLVVPGDSLAAISQQYYNTIQGYDRIFAANRDTLDSPNLIRVGQSLLIPQ